MGRALLVQIDALYPPRHGGAKANLLLVRELARRGHACEIVLPVVCGPADDPDTAATMLQRYDALPTRFDAARTPGGTIRWTTENIRHHGVDVSTDRFLPFLKVCLRQYAPDVVLASDAGGPNAGAILATIAEEAPGRLVYLPKTVNYLPFGPYALAPDDLASDCIRHARMILANSAFVANTIASALGRPVTHAYFPVYGVNPIAPGHDRSVGYVTLVNACPWKGLPIFEALARRLPNLPFLAVASWGSRDADLAGLRTLPNVHVIGFTEDMESVYAQTRVLLTPSLWQEAFGQVVIQAMARGIPVLAADIGGLPEAKLGVPYLLPVTPLPGSAEPPGPAVPPQEVGPWQDALEALWRDIARYQALSTASHAAATAFLESLSWDPIVAQVFGEAHEAA